MVGIRDIENALIADITANQTVLKTVKTFDTNFDQNTLAQYITLSPFALLHWAGARAIEAERDADEGSGMDRESFSVYVGAQSLLSRSEAQKGAYDIIDFFRQRYRGLSLTISGETLTFAIGGVSYVPFGAGIVVYLIELYYFQTG
jgi:phage gp37-like protein